MSTPAESAEQEFVRLYGEKAWNDWQSLLTHIEFTEGFALFVVLLPGAVGLGICHRHLDLFLGEKGRKLISLPCKQKEDARRIGDHIFKLENDPDVGAIWVGGFEPSNDPEIDEWRTAWRDGLGRLNQHRNQLRRRIRVPLVVAGAPWIQDLIREAAPDVWSVRSTVVSIVPNPVIERRDLSHQTSIDLASILEEKAASDPDYALELAERLRSQPSREAQRADLLYRAGSGFYTHFRPAAAEGALREAVALLSKIAATSKAESAQTDLAGSLNGLGLALAELGRREEALDTTQRLVDLCRKLSKQQPDAFLPKLAVGLNNLANRLSDLGRREEALGAAQQALKIYQELERQAKAFPSELAKNLSNLAKFLSQLGRHKDALDAARQAVQINQQLAEQQPETYTPILASSLGNLANVLSSLGRREEALNTAQQAVQIYRELAEQNPDAFLVNLGINVDNLANRFGDLGRYQDALKASQQAVQIHQRLVEQRPDTYLPGLATSFNNLARIQSALGRRENALVAARKAVEIRRKLAKQRPDAFLPDLAISLHNVATFLRDLGRTKEAMEFAQQAVEHFCRLAKERPDVFLPDLAVARCGLGQVFQDMERWPDAVESAAQGIRELAPAFQALPKALAPRMNALVRLYRVGAEEAQIEIDTEMLDPILEQFQQLGIDDDEMVG